LLGRNIKIIFHIQKKNVNFPGQISKLLGAALMKMENILQYWGLLGDARSAFDYEKHEESSAGISQRKRL